MMPNAVVSIADDLSAGQPDVCGSSAQNKTPCWIDVVFCVFVKRFVMGKEGVRA